MSLRLGDIAPDFEQDSSAGKIHFHLWCESTGSTDSAMALTPRLANSSLSLAVKPSSVVHTGVKSA